MPSKQLRRLHFDTGAFCFGALWHLKLEHAILQCGGGFRRNHLGRQIDHAQDFVRALLLVHSLPLLLLFFGFLLAANGQPPRFDVDLQVLGLEARYFCLNRECLIRFCDSYLNRVKQFGFGLEPVVELMAKTLPLLSKISNARRAIEL
jgi:hypothetical protein